MSYKKKLGSLLADNEVKSFIFYHKKMINGDLYYSLISGTVTGNEVHISNINVNKNILPDIPSNVTNEVFSYSFSSNGLLFDNSLKIALKTGDNLPVKFLEIPDFNYTDLYKDGSFGSIEDRDYKNIYDALSKHLKTKEEQLLLDKYKQFGSNISKQLANPFYKDVDIAVNVQVRNKDGKVINGGDLTYKTDYKKKKNDINIQIFLNADGSYSIKQKFSDTYLKEFEKKWIEEARKRGLDVDIPEMREDIIAFLNSKEAELSFGKKFLREIRTWFDTSVAGYIEGIQATQKITRNIWDAGVINESTWHSTGENSAEHTKWPVYMQFNPVVGGAVDGIIDEIVGIPMACKSVYEIATDDEKRKALAKVFTSEGFSQMLDGLKESVTELRDDAEVRGHFGGQTAVSVISMMSGTGLISKIGKADEMTEVMQKTNKFVGNAPNPNIKHLDDVKKSENVIHNPENRKLVNEFMEKQDDVSISDLADELAEDIDVKKTAQTDPPKFILGKKLEQALSDKITKEMAGSGNEILQKISQKAGVSITELASMKHVTQLQLNLPNGGFTIIDDVFIKESVDVITNKKIYELILSETKLSNLSPFTGRQDSL
ncbi:MAG TPA: hypothetical protein PKX92_10730 [Edaphocola sp.]|nr:hypothetical protein [Edaphocola sp.]